MSRSKSCALWIALIGMTTACHAPKPVLPAPAPAPPPVATAPARPPVPPPTPPAPPPVIAAPAPTTTPLTEEEAFRRMSLDQLNAQHPLTDVFFALDKSVLDDTDREALDHNAHWLQRWKQTTIDIEGYCDERGTAEYNMALGDRRARAARDYLKDLGVDAGRIRVVSFGKERGFCRESTEACWAQNRRGHFVITAK